MAQHTRSVSAIELWNGEDLLNAFAFATRWLDHNRDLINGLNVFPVPDGDTGTNMALTMHAAVDAARSADHPEQAGSVANKLAYGALMGARGNSGVILSQIFRGFAAAIVDRDTIDGQDLARALEGARQMAYEAVMRPVEGTMLTIIRVAAEHGATAATRTSSLITLLEDVLTGAREALAQTPDMLEILRQAGVVDAGGQGVAHILEGLLRYAEEDTIIDDASASMPVGAEMRSLDDIAETHGEDTFGYCTNFMVFGNDMDFEHIRAKIAAMGESAVIVGDNSIVKVHVHTEKPGSVLEYALGVGYLDQIKIDNMALQTEALSVKRQYARTGTAASYAGPSEEADIAIDSDIGVIAIAAGIGLASALRSMGAHYIVPGGQTMNPSTMELLAAVQKLQVDKIIILPNNKNILMAANQVPALTCKTIKVIPSRSVPDGLTALAAFRRDASIADNVRNMTDAMDHVQSIEITEAVRDVELNGVTVVAGNLIGVVNGELVTAGADLGDVVSTTLMTLEHGEPELLTVFAGEDATNTATEVLRKTAEAIFPDAEIEIIDGNQPYYQYLIAVE